MTLLKSAFNDAKTRAAITRTLNRVGVKREIGKRFVERVRERTADNVDKDGKSFAKYSKSYIESTAFELYAKSRGDVNMTLSGEMLASMDVARVTARGFQVAFSSRTQNNKAHGHINGGGSLPVRDFFGLPVKEQVSILKEVVREFNEDLEILDASVPVSVGNQAIFLEPDEDI